MQAVPLPEDQDKSIMGRFDRRKSTKMRQRKSQAKKKEREQRAAEQTKAERKSGG
jgi:hypothetical protein